jgi:hypothetical protein
MMRQSKGIEDVTARVMSKIVVGAVLRKRIVESWMRGKVVCRADILSLPATSAGELPNVPIDGRALEVRAIKTG